MTESMIGRATYIDRPFRGKSRRFQLTYDKMQELERETGQGVCAISMRVSSFTASSAEIIQTIRLALEGGGTGTHDATALMVAVMQEPLGAYIDLAAEILAACMYGVAPDEASPPQSAEAA